MKIGQAGRTARPTWANTRTLTGLVLFIVALFAGRQFLAQASTTASVWAATEDLPSGTRIDEGLLRPVEVRLSPEQASLYVPADHKVDGAVVTRAVLRGELIAAAWLAADPLAGPGRAMTIPITPEHAVGGGLRPGDRIDVYATFSAGAVRARTSLLVRSVEVIDIVTAGGLVVGDEALVGVTVAVTPYEAGRLAFAIRTAELDIVRVVSRGRARAPTSFAPKDFR